MQLLVSSILLISALLPPIMKDHKIILKNFIGSYLMKRHFFCMVILVPFLIRTVGIENFGTLEFCKSIAYYFTIFINYGFNYSATQQIVEAPNDRKHVGLVVSSTYLGKTLLLAVGTVVLLCLFSCSQKIAAHKDFMLAFFGVAVGSAFTPNFLYQGLNKIDWLVYIDFFCRSIFLIATFTIIREPSQAILYPAFYAMTDIARAVIALTVAHLFLKVRFHMPNLRQVKAQFYEGYNIFVANFCRTIYDRLPQAIIGFTLGSTSVAFYIVGTRVIGELNMFTYQMMQAVYPIAAKKIKENLSEGLSFIKRFNLAMLIFLVPACICLFIYSQEIVHYIAKNKILVEDIPRVAMFLKICSCLPVAVFLYTSYGDCVLIPLGKGKQNSTIVIAMSILATAIYSVLLSRKGLLGVISTIVSVEVVTMCVIVFYANYIVSKK